MLQKMEDEMISCNYNKTFSEMAMALGIARDVSRVPSVSIQEFCDAAFH